MELREFWRILRRRWWIPVTLVVLVGLFSIVHLQLWQPQPESYIASMRLLVGVMPATEADTTAYDPRYYAWLTSEYLVDDFTEVVRSDLFAQNLSERLTDQDIQIPAGIIQGSAATGKQHRIISLNFGWENSEELAVIANAAATELVQNAPVYFRQLGTEGAGITLLDGPNIAVVGPSLRQRLDLPLRLLLALFIGVGLVFLLDYLDTSVRDGKELEELGFRIIGEIPKHR